MVVYTTTWCGYCHRLTSQLERAGIEFDQVDIETTPGAADLVTRLNAGNATVPTVVFPDGSTATNPSLALVQARLQAPASLFATPGAP